MHDHTAEKAKTVIKLVDAYYEEGNQQRCKTAAYRAVVHKQQPMSRRTFFRYLKRAREIPL
jgi:hypothetical protein